MSLRAALALAVLVGAAGCGDGCKSKEPSPEPGAEAKLEASKPAPPAAAATAVIEGVVRLGLDNELPSYPHEQMEKKVLEHTERAPLPAECSPPKTTDRQPVQITPDGLLTNIVVAASDFKHQPQRAPLVHDVVIENCRLKPAVVAAMKGDTLRIRNTLEYPFMPAYGPTDVVRTLIKGQSFEAVLDKPGYSPLLCGFTAPCGRTDVVVMLHPVTAVTDAQGKFRIENFPAGETVKLSAWHPLFQESSVEVRAEPGEVKRVELTILPLPQQPVPAEGKGAQPKQGAKEKGAKPNEGGAKEKGTRPQ